MTNNEKLILKAIQTLNPILYHNTDDDLVVSGDYKYEFFDKFMELIQDLKSKGHEGFNYKETTCKYCYPEYRVFEFYDIDSGKFVDRFIIHQEKNSSIMFMKCCNEKNNPWMDALRSLNHG